MESVATQHRTKTRPDLPALFWLGALIIPLLLALVGCGTADKPQLTRFAGSTMGTTYHITVSSPLTESRQQSVQAGIDRLLNSVNQQMSTYIADSELMRFNAAPAGEWFAVSSELAQVLAVSSRVYRDSLGGFDITVGPLVELWGFGARNTEDQVPAAETIAGLLSEIGADKLEIDLDQGRVRKHGDIRLDLSAVAKGYGADLVSGWLLSEGFADSLVEIGGELRLRGKSPRGSAWKIGVESPQLAQGETQRAIEVTDAGVATSGDYRNYFEVDGKRYSHTLDPRTGYPVQHTLASVTVIADSAAEADAWATALSVLGPEQAATIVEEQNLAAFFIIRAGNGFKESHSSAFARYLSPLTP